MSDSPLPSAGSPCISNQALTTHMASSRQAHLLSLIHLLGVCAGNRLSVFYSVNIKALLLPNSSVNIKTLLSPVMNPLDPHQTQGLRV